MLLLAGLALSHSFSRGLQGVERPLIPPLALGCLTGSHERSEGRGSGWDSRPHGVDRDQGRAPEGQG